jgi:hypothetical protein
MATIPNGTKFIGIDASIPTPELNGKTINNKTQHYTVEDLAATVGVGSQGPQGIQGPAGPPGPVGPAGLEWQGSWDTDSSYNVDDAVGFNGASWFCISEVTGTGNSNPEEDTVSWALLAAQGAVGPQGEQGPTGPQGPQGESGSAPVYTQGIGISTTSASNASNVLLYNQNIITPSANNQSVRLPQNAPIGTEIIVRYNTSASVGNTLNVRPFLLGTTISSLQNVNSNSDRYVLSENDNVKFISRGSDFWLVEAITYDNVSFNNFKTGSRGMIIQESYYEYENTALSSANLQEFPYSSYIEGAKVYRPNITEGGLVYIKVQQAEIFNNVVQVPAVWVSIPITTVV